MKNPPLIALVLLVAAMLACNLPGSDVAGTPILLTPVTGLTPIPGEEETSTPISTAVATALGAAPSPNVPVLLITATAVIPPTPSVPMITPNAVNVNCRAGPDLAYNSVSVLAFGASTQVVGRTADSSWWYVQDPNNPGGNCWVAASVVTILGPTAAIPVAALPPPIANKVTVAVNSPTSVVCGQPNPVTFSGTISTNGAATVQYQWEITGSQTNTTGPQTLAFTGAGTQAAANPGAINVDCGNYTVTLHVTSPNDLSASKTFTISNP